MRKMSALVLMCMYFVGICLLLCSGYSQAEEPNMDVLYESFQISQTAVQRLNLDDSEWSVSDGVLISRNKADSVVSFQFGKPEWRDYDVEFKIRRTAISYSDQHFGIRIRCSDKGSVDPTYLQFYCRGNSVIMLENAAGKTLRHDLVGNLPVPLELGDNAPWTKFRINVNASSARVYVDGELLGTVSDVAPRRGQIAFYTYGVALQLDDINVTVSGMEEAGMPDFEPSRNILSNSSFEYCTLDELPDYWGCPHWGLMDPYWAVNFEQWTKHFRTDTETAFDGSKSMRIEVPSEKALAGSGLNLRSTQIGTTANQKYTLSAYMKSSTEGMKARFAGREVVLSTDWQRYSVDFMQDGQSPYSDMINIIPLSVGIFWIDAVQLEKGEEMTPYVHSLRDRILSEQADGVKKSADVPVCNPKKATNAIEMDGKLSGLDWESAEKLNFKLLNGGEPVEASYAKITYDTSGIYVGVYCSDSGAETVECKMTERDSHVWNDPSIEIFVDPKLSKSDYYHFSFNKNGVMCDAKGADTGWNCQWKVATNIGKGYWTAVAFIPFSELEIGNMSGDTWGINVCRSNQQVNEYTCWSPTFAGFHTPDRFGEVKLDSAVLDNYRIYIENTRLSIGSGDTCSLSMDIVNAANNTSEFMVKAFSDSGNPEFMRSVKIAGKSGKRVSIGNIKQADISGKLWKISVLSSDSKTPLYSGNIQLTCPPAIEMTPQFDLYTFEKQMRVRLRLGIAPAIAEKSTAVITINSKGKSVYTEKITELSEEIFFSVPVDKLANGRYGMSAKVINNGKTIALGSQEFTRAPGKSNEVKIDRFARSVSIGGKPFVPIGYAWEGDLPVELLKYLAKNGSNMICVFYEKDKLGKLLDDAHSCGLKVKAGISARELEKARDLINTYKNHPALLAWDIFDEVFTMEWGKNNYQTVVDACKSLKETDPYHPVYINENEYGLSYLKSQKLDFPGDIISVDYYAYPPSGNVQAIGDYVKQMYEAGKSGDRPCWIYGFATGYAFWASRDLSPDEQVCSTYLCLVNGATGIFYWASHPKSISQWNKIRELMSEVKQLSPAITSHASIKQAECSSPVIKILTKKYNGAVYVIAINSSRDQTAARISLSSIIPDTAKADVLFENRATPVKNKSINDVFRGFERHVYKIKLR